MRRRISISWRLIATLLVIAASGSAAHGQLLHQWTFNGDANDLVGSAHGALVNGATISGGRLQLDGANDFMRSAVLRSATNEPVTLTTKTLIAWVSLDSTTQAGGGALTIERPSGADVFDSIVFNELGGNRWMAGSNVHARTQSPQAFGSAETVTSPGEVMIAISYASDNSISVYRNGALYGTYTKGALENYSTATASDVLVGKRHMDAGGGSFLDGSINEVRVYGSAMNAAQIAAVYADGPTTATNPTRALADPLHRWSFNDGTANDSIGTAHGTLINGASISGGQLSLDGVNDYMRSAPLPGGLTSKSLVAWVTLSDLSQTAGSALTVETTNGATFDGIVYGERTAGQWMNGSNGFARSNPVNNGGAIETSLDEVMMAIVYDADGTINLYRDGELYASQTVGGPIEFLGGSTDVLIGLRHLGAGGDPYLTGLINEARIYGVALTADEIQTLYLLGPDALQTPEPASIALWSFLACALGLFVVRAKQLKR